MNLAPVIGNIQATVNILSDTGQREIADALKKLAETIAETQAIKEGQKREAVELVAALGDELSKPEVERRTGVLRTLAARVGHIIRGASEVAAVYEALKVAVRAATGIELP